MAWQRLSLRCSAVLLLFCGVANCQSEYLVRHCLELDHSALMTLGSGQSETIIEAERKYLADCSELMSKKQQTHALVDIGMELINQRQV